MDDDLKIFSSAKDFGVTFSKAWSGLHTLLTWLQNLIECWDSLKRNYSGDLNKESYISFVRSNLCYTSQL